MGKKPLGSGTISAGRIRTMNVGEVCRLEDYIFKADEPLASAAAEMIKHHIGAVVVEPERVQPVGIRRVLAT